MLPFDILRIEVVFLSAALHGRCFSLGETERHTSTMQSPDAIPARKRLRKEEARHDRIN